MSKSSEPNPQFDSCSSSNRGEHERIAKLNRDQNGNIRGAPFYLTKDQLEQLEQLKFGDCSTDSILYYIKDGALEVRFLHEDKSD